jgi:ribA/ribD-fused uncharacterized protein
MANDLTTTDRFVFFWDGWPSQWHPSTFSVDEHEYNCCEQFMMAEKARFFGDQAILQEIMRSRNPREQKALGRKVSNFDSTSWNRVCRGIVYRGNLAKFEQNGEVRELLLGTGNREIVEASPTDRIWGIGLAASDVRALDRGQWRGTNWLGIALMQVRDALRPRERDEPRYVMDSDLLRQLKDRGELRKG